MKEQNRREFIRKAGFFSMAAFISPHAILTASASTINKESKFKTKLADGSVLVFQGDSITDGNRGRNNDPNHIMGHGYAFSIACRIGADNPKKRLTFYNRGISGNTVSDLAARWQKDCLDLKPNILSVLIGINDINNYIQTNNSELDDKFEETYTILLNKVKTQNPDILFVLCQPFILPVGRVEKNWDKFHNEIVKRQEIVKRIAHKYNALVVDFQQVMTNACNKAPAEYWMWDGIHPTVAGHELLAREWIKCVSKKLRFEQC